MFGYFRFDLKFGLEKLKMLRYFHCKLFLFFVGGLRFLNDIEMKKLTFLRIFIVLQSSQNYLQNGIVLTLKILVLILQNLFENGQYLHFC